MAAAVGWGGGGGGGAAAGIGAAAAAVALFLLRLKRLHSLEDLDLKQTRGLGCGLNVAAWLARVWPARASSWPRLAQLGGLYLGP